MDEEVITNYEGRITSREYIQKGQLVFPAALFNSLRISAAAVIFIATEGTEFNVCALCGTNNR